MVQEIKTWIDKHWKQVLVQICLRIVTVFLAIASTYVPGWHSNGLISLGLLEMILQSAQADVRAKLIANSAQLGIPAGTIPPVTPVA